MRSMECANAYVEPYTLLSLILIWIVGAFLIAVAGRRRKFGFAGNLVVSLLFTPFIGVLVLVASDPRVECDCRDDT